MAKCNKKNKNKNFMTINELMCHVLFVIIFKLLKKSCH